MRFDALGVTITVVGDFQHGSGCRSVRVFYDTVVYPPIERPG